MLHFVSIGCIKLHFISSFVARLRVLIFSTIIFPYWRIKTTQSILFMIYIFFLKLIIVQIFPPMETRLLKREAETAKRRIFLSLWSIVFGRIRDRVHKFPWHSRGSALRLIPRAKTLKVWTDKWGEAVGPQSSHSDTDRWIRTICGGGRKGAALCCICSNWATARVWKNNWNHESATKKKKKHSKQRAAPIPCLFFIPHIHGTSLHFCSPYKLSTSPHNSTLC